MRNSETLSVPPPVTPTYAPTNSQQIDEPDTSSGPHRTTKIEAIGGAVEAAATVDVEPEPFRTKRQEWLHWLFTTDFFPDFDKRFFKPIRTPLGIVVFSTCLTFICGCLLTPQVFLLSAAGACVLVIGLLYPWISVRAIQCQLAFSSQQVVEFETADAELTVQNMWPIPVWGLAVEVCESDDALISLACSPAWSRNHYSWQFTPGRRGNYPPAGAFVTSAFPFGLWTAKLPLQVDDSVVVWPQPVPVAEVRQPKSNVQHHEGALISAPGTFPESIGIRSYRSGDSLRDIHWKATARSNELMVKERPSLSTSRLDVTLEVAPQAVADKATFDWAVRMVAGICESYFKANCNLALRVGPQHIEIGSRRSFRSAMDLLAVVTPSEAFESNSNVKRRSSARIRVAIGESEAGAHYISVDSDFDEKRDHIEIEAPQRAPHSMQDFEQLVKANSLTASDRSHTRPDHAA